VALAQLEPEGILLAAAVLVSLPALRPVHS
jgi:hypothetical protein